MFGLNVKKKKSKVIDTVSDSGESKSEVYTISDGAETATASDQGEEGSEFVNPEADATQPQKKEQQLNEVSHKEIKALKRAKYDKIGMNFKEIFVIRNKKSGMIVELRAASMVHAANLIGWRPRQVELIERKEVNDPVVELEPTAAEKELPPGLR